MAGRCHRHEIDLPDGHALKRGIIDHHRPGNAQIGALFEQQRGDRAKRLDMKAQVHRGESDQEILKQPREQAGWKHHIDRHRQLGFEPLVVAAHPRHHRVDIVGHRPRAGEHRPARIGQLRLARALAVEQRHPQLPFEVGDAIADHRDRPPHAPRRPIETAFIDNRQKDANLVDTGLAYIHARGPVQKI
jgi:hypothetical protein